MTTRNLDYFIQENGIDPKSKLATDITRKLIHVSEVDEGTFQFVLDRLKNGKQYSARKNSRDYEERPTEQKTRPRRKSRRKRASEERPSSIENALSYNEALKYVVKIAPQLEASILMANVDPDLETANEYWYSKEKVHTEATNAIKLGYFRREEL